MWKVYEDINSDYGVFMYVDGDVDMDNVKLFDVMKMVIVVNDELMMIDESDVYFYEWVLDVLNDDK